MIDKTSLNKTTEKKICADFILTKLSHFDTVINFEINLPSFDV